MIHWTVYRIGAAGLIGMLDGTDVAVRKMFVLVWMGMASSYETAILAAVDKECGL